MFEWLTRINIIKMGVTYPSPPAACVILKRTWSGKYHLGDFVTNKTPATCEYTRNFFGQKPAQSGLTENIEFCAPKPVCYSFKFSVNY